MDSSSITNNWLETANIDINSSIFSEAMSPDISLEKMGELSKTKDVPYPYKALIYLIN